MRKVITWIYYKNTCINNFNVIKKMRQGGMYTTLTKEQINEIQTFFTNHYGEKIKLDWHEYYYYVNKEFSPKYIPTYIYYGKIYPKLNDSRFVLIYSDKNMIEKLVGNKVKCPKTYVKAINDIFYINNNVVSLEEAINECLNIKDGIIKHSIESSMGMSIIRFKSINGIVEGKNCPKTITELFSNYKTDFVIQDAIQQHPEMAKLNHTSLNTIRVMTYWSKSGIVTLYSVLRIGRSGAVVDNASAGGIYCGINDDGSLKENAYTLEPLTIHTKTDTGIILKNFKIPMYDKIKAKAVELHQQLPYCKLIGWDLCIDDNNEIELVEINADKPGVFQAATGPAFGDYTEEILELFLPSKNYKR